MKLEPGEGARGSCTSAGTSIDRGIVYDVVQLEVLPSAIECTEADCFCSREPPDDFFLI